MHCYCQFMFCCMRYINGFPLCKGRCCCCSYFDLKGYFCYWNWLLHLQWTITSQISTQQADYLQYFHIHFQYANVLCSANKFGTTLDSNKHVLIAFPFLRNWALNPTAFKIHSCYSFILRVLNIMHFCCVFQPYHLNKLYTSVNISCLLTCARIMHMREL